MSEQVTGSAALQSKDLQQLAREYAEQNPPTGIRDDVLRENAISLNAEIFYKHLKWLSSRYCIVEKSKIIENYQSLKRDIPALEDDPKRHLGFLGGMTELEMLFGKELFNETEQ